MLHTQKRATETEADRKVREEADRKVLEADAAREARPGRRESSSAFSSSCSDDCCAVCAFFAWAGQFVDWMTCGK